VTSEEQLAWESRAGKPAATAAIASVVLTLAAPAIQIATIGEQGKGELGLLRLVDEESTAFAVVQAVQSAAYLLTAIALLYLLKCTLARRAEVPRLVLPLIMIGPVLLVVGAVLTFLELTGIADELTKSGGQTEKRADDLLGDANPLGSLIALAGTFCVAVSFVLVALNSMRAGLLSQFMGILGVIVGALLVLPIPGLSQTQFIVQAFWMGALAALFLDRWPKGRGPAWSVVEPVPWPSARALARGEQAGAIPADDPTIEPAANLDEPGGDASDPRGEPNPASKKRKRKRRS